MGVHLQGLLVPLGIVGVVAAVLLGLRSLTLGLLARKAGQTTAGAEHAVLSAFRGPSLYWCVAVALYVGIAVSDLNPRYVNYISKAVHVLVILSVTIVIANLSGRLMKDYVRKTNLPVPETGLVYAILKGTIFALGFLVILGVFDIAIAPLITALGVGGLAVALALQDTLANLFSGMHILVEKSIRLGDFIRLETGQEGYVEDITWRTTRIRMLPNNMVVIPNHKLAQSIVTNYYLPEKKTGVSISVRAGYASDPDRVIFVLVDEVRKSVGVVQGLLGDPEPSAQLTPGFGESSLKFTLSFHVEEFTKQYGVQSELRKRVLQRFRKEGIDFPLPQQTVFVRSEKA